MAKQKICWLCKYSFCAGNNIQNRIDEDFINNNEDDFNKKGISEYEDMVRHDKSFYCKVLCNMDYKQSKSMQIKAYVQGFHKVQNKIKPISNDIVAKNNLKVDEFEIDVTKSFLNSGRGIPIEQVKSVLKLDEHSAEQNMPSLVLWKSLDKIINSLKRQHQIRYCENKDPLNTNQLPSKIVHVASLKKDSIACALVENAKKRRKSTNTNLSKTKTSSVNQSSGKQQIASHTAIEVLDHRLNSSDKMNCSSIDSDELKCSKSSERSYSLSDCNSEMNPHQICNREKKLVEESTDCIDKEANIPVENRSALKNLLLEKKSRCNFLDSAKEKNNNVAPLEFVTENSPNITKVLENGETAATCDNLRPITEQSDQKSMDQIDELIDNNWPSLEAEIISSPDMFTSRSSPSPAGIVSTDHFGIIALQTEAISSSEDFTHDASFSDLGSSLSSLESFSFF